MTAKAVNDGDVHLVDSPRASSSIFNHRQASSSVVLTVGRSDTHKKCTRRKVLQGAEPTVHAIRVTQKNIVHTFARLNRLNQTVRVRLPSIYHLTRFVPKLFVQNLIF